MISKRLNPIEGMKYGDAREKAVAMDHKARWYHHDGRRYDKASDVVDGELKITVKSARFTLMSGTLCEGETTMEGIWRVYELNTHSNMAAYVTEDFVSYEMTISEFKSFVFRFCMIEKDSGKNKGNAKIRMRRENDEVRAWLAERAN